MALSPYTPGSVPTRLSGRADRLERFREAARRIDSGEQFVPRIHIDHGPRGVGKTSLLREAQRIFGSYGVKTILVTADPNENLSRSLLSELKQVVGTGTRIRKAAIETIDSATLALGVPGIANLAVTVKPSSDTASASAKQFQRALQAALDAVISDGGSGIAILVDEIQEADAASLRTIGYAWQEMNPLNPLAANQPRTALFAVGLPGAPNKVNRAVTFSERFSFEPLHDLSEAGAREALESISTDVSVIWDRAALDRGVLESAGYPYKVQLLGDASWKAATKRLGAVELNPGDVITLTDVEVSLLSVERDMLTLFQSRWRGSSTKQQQMLVAIASLGGTDVKRAVLADALDSNTRAISVIRQRLLDKGLLDANKHGHLSFTVPGFTEFVVDQAENE